MQKFKIRKCDIAAKVKSRKIVKSGIRRYFQHSVTINLKRYILRDTGMISVYSHDSEFVVELPFFCDRKQQFIDIVYDHVNQED